MKILKIMLPRMSIGTFQKMLLGKEIFFNDLQLTSFQTNGPFYGSTKETVLSMPSREGLQSQPV